MSKHISIWCILSGHKFGDITIESTNIISQTCDRCELYRAKYISPDGTNYTIVK